MGAVNRQRQSQYIYIYIYIYMCVCVCVCDLSCSFCLPLAHADVTIVTCVIAYKSLGLFDFMRLRKDRLPPDKSNAF